MVLIDETDERKRITHYIKLNDDIEVHMKIPEVLNSMEFKAITTMANKLFNLSEVPIVQQNMGVKRTYTKRAYNKTNAYNSPFSNEMLDFISDNERSGIDSNENYKLFQQKFNSDVDVKKFKTKLSNLKYSGRIKLYGSNSSTIVEEVQAGKIESNHKRRRGKVFTESQVNTIILHKKSGLTSNKISEKINSAFGTEFTARQIADKIVALKNKGLI